MTPGLTVSYKECLEEDLFIDTYYNDWEDYRDGLRDWFSDRKLIKNIPTNVSHLEGFEERVKANKKQKILSQRRKKRNVRE